MTQEKFEKQVNEIKSLFTKRHAHIIYGLIRWLQPEHCVEIGAFEGYISAWIAKGLQDNDRGMLYCVDNWSLGTTAQQIHNNLVMLELANQVAIFDVNQFPDQAPCDFAFIDADHSLDGVTNDVINVINRGASCIVLHDTTSWWGPKQFIEKIKPISIGPVTSSTTSATYDNYDSIREHFNFIQQHFDEGLTIMMRKLPSIPVTYSEEDYPKGHVYFTTQTHGAKE